MQLTKSSYCCVFRPASTCLHSVLMVENHEKCFSPWAFHEPLVRMMEKVLFHDFWMFFIIFDHANAWASMHSLVEIHNTNTESETSLTFISIMENLLWRKLFNLVWMLKNWLCPLNSVWSTSWLVKIHNLQFYSKCCQFLQYFILRQQWVSQNKTEWNQNTRPGLDPYPLLNGEQT